MRSKQQHPSLLFSSFPVYFLIHSWVSEIILRCSDGIKSRKLQKKKNDHSQGIEQRTKGHGGLWSNFPSDSVFSNGGRKAEMPWYCFSLDSCIHATENGVTDSKDIGTRCLSGGITDPGMTAINTKARVEGGRRALLRRMEINRNHDRNL